MLLQDHNTHYLRTSIVAAQNLGVRFLSRDVASPTKDGYMVKPDTGGWNSISGEGEVYLHEVIKRAEDMLPWVDGVLSNLTLSALSTRVTDALIVDACYVYIREGDNGDRQPLGPISKLQETYRVKLGVGRDRLTVEVEHPHTYHFMQEPPTASTTTTTTVGSSGSGSAANTTQPPPEKASSDSSSDSSSENNTATPSDRDLKKLWANNSTEAEKVGLHKWLQFKRATPASVVNSVTIIKAFHERIPIIPDGQHGAGSIVNFRELYRVLAKIGSITTLNRHLKDHALATRYMAMTERNRPRYPRIATIVAGDRVIPLQHRSDTVAPAVKPSLGAFKDYLDHLDEHLGVKPDVPYNR